MQKKVTMRFVFISLIAVAAVASIVLTAILLLKEQPSHLIGFVVDNGNGFIMVEPQAGSEIENDRYQVSMMIGKENNIMDELKKPLSLNSLPEGCIVEITYNGKIMESEPPQIEASGIVLLKEL